MRKVVFSIQSADDLRSIGLYIGTDSPQAARRFVLAIQEHCVGLSVFPERGKRRDDLSPGLRTIAYDRRVTIAFKVEPERVTIVRIFYRGRNVEDELGKGS